MILPLDIYKIVNKYMYDTVLDQFKTVYGKTLSLKIIKGSCWRVKADSLAYLDSRVWKEKIWDRYHTEIIMTGYAMWYDSLNDVGYSTYVIDNY